VRRIAIISLVVLIAAAGGYILSARVWGFPVFWSAEDEEETAKSVIYSLGQFVTNLADPGRYVRVSIELEIQEGPAGEKLISNITEIKTDIYALLRSKTYQELQGEDGLRDLQKDILNRIESKYPGVVENVFFGEFLIQ